MGSLFEAPALRAYRESLAHLKPLDRDEERELARRWKGGDRKAAERIILGCLPFVVAVALEYRRWGVPLEDIIQQGNLGLLRAVEKFDPDRDCRLATYAVYWIRAEIRDYVIRTYRVVRLGTTKGERRALRAYRRTRETDPARLAEASGLDPSRVAVLLPLLVAREASLDAKASDATSIAERLASPSPTPEDSAGDAELRAKARAEVNLALRTLTARERLIVHERIMNDAPATLQSLGDRLGVSKERVRQLEERAKLRLRSSLEGLRELAAS
jgi:RNA polymerase sigma-32 factor